ncbi:hypothetical protein OG216_12535 [Streptomycetaceae bacterium NBC_01309]
MESAIPRYPTNVIVSGPRKVALVDRGAHGLPYRALVLVRRDGSMTTRTRRPSLWESLRFRHRYDVNTQAQRSTWTRYLPSADPGAQFRADVRALWHVTGPVQAIRRELRTVDDAERVIAAVLHARLEEMTKDQWPDQVDDTYQRVDAACAEPPDLGDAGITVLDVTVAISAPDPRRLRDILSGIVEGKDPQPADPPALLEAAASGLSAPRKSPADDPDAQPQAPSFRAWGLSTPPSAT